jgi:nitrilase
MDRKSGEVKVAAVQACPVFLDREATIEKACDLIRKVGEDGVSLAVFPEAFVPAYPLWVWFVPPGRTPMLRALYAELLDQSVTIPGPSTDRLCDAARRAGVAIAIGVNERNAEASDSTLYNTLLYIGPDGAILGKHRKLIPTAGERLVWGQGDGSDLRVYDLPFARLGGLLCWENYMPLARYALYAWGMQVLAAPTWDRGEPWLSTLRHVGKEGRSFVIGCCSPVRQADVPDRLEFKKEYLESVGEWLNPGGSAIVDPDGKVVAGPAEKSETVLYADIHRDQITGPRFQLDTAGHYGRPDVFELRVHRRAKPMLTIVEEEEPTNEKSAGDDE